MLAKLTFGRTGVDAVDRLADLVTKAINLLLGDPFADHADIPRTVVTTGVAGNTVNHTLGRTPLFMVPTYLNTSANIWLLSATDKTVVVACDIVNTTVSLRVW